MNKDTNAQFSSKKLARLLDSRFELPFGISVGLDGILGLVPVVGDLITTSLSLLIVGDGVRHGASKAVIMRMLVNIFIDNILGKIPVVGILADFLWKSNLKNIELLEAHQLDPSQTKSSSKVFLAVTFLIFLTLILGTVALSIFVIYLFWQALH